MPHVWLPESLVCRVCARRFSLYNAESFSRHVLECVERHADYIDSLRPPEFRFGDPELAAFAREEGDVYNRRPGTRKQPR